ncbi:MAG: hypothetical protein Q6362_002755 [Candidatus Wukongarchaeota archaeon]|nr:hypothetical protein [Candidatus Wukongarchaeota archaeon]
MVGEMARCRYEYVRLVGKASVQLSHHVKDGVTEPFIIERILRITENEKEYLENGSYKVVDRVKIGHRKPVRVYIFVRELEENCLVKEFKVYGIHLERE